MADSWPLAGPNTLHYLADNRKDLPKGPQPQGNPKTSKETGANLKTTVTPAAWRNTATNVTAHTTQDHEVPLEGQGYARMQEMEEFFFGDIVQGTPYHVPDTTPSAPPYIMTATSA